MPQITKNRRSGLDNSLNILNGWSSRCINLSNVGCPAQLSLVGQPQARVLGDPEGIQQHPHRRPPSGQLLQSVSVGTMPAEATRQRARFAGIKLDFLTFYKVLTTPPPLHLESGWPVQSVMDIWKIPLNELFFCETFFVVNNIQFIKILWFRNLNTSFQVSIRNLSKARPEPLVHFLYVVLDKLLDMMVNPVVSNNAQRSSDQATFLTSLILHCISLVLFQCYILVLGLLKLKWVWIFRHGVCPSWNLSNRQFTQ